MTPTVQLLFEHDDFLVTVKPPGLSFHTESADTDTAAGSSEALPDPSGHVAAVRALLAQRGDGRNGFDMPLHPVHRLDRITSGLVVLARSPQAARAFGEGFAAGAIDKLYLALSDRRPLKKQGTIRGSMIRARNGNWRLSRGATDGSLAVTHFHSWGLGGLRLFLLRPRTGRTHQLRVALKSLGSPILGDMRYGGSAADRGYLHAWRLRFDWRGEPYAFCAPPGPGAVFADAVCVAKLDEIGDPWALPWPGH